jgi:hypothetical protein
MAVELGCGGIPGMSINANAANGDEGNTSAAGDGSGESGSGGGGGGGDANDIAKAAKQLAEELSSQGGPEDPFLDDQGERYVRSKHFPGGSQVDETKGIFNANEDPYALAEAGAGAPWEGPNENGFYERRVNAGRIVGNISQKSGGWVTTFYRIVQDIWGGIITMYPEK